MNKLKLLILLPAIVLAGCLNLPKNKEKMKLTIDNKEYLLEVAKNQEQREKGLMDRRELAENRGMIFYFDNPDYLSFWMKNTYIPLQIIFINGCEIVDIQEMAVEPDPANPQKKYVSKQPADKAIELNPWTTLPNVLNSKIVDLCIDIDLKV